MTSLGLLVTTTFDLPDAVVEAIKKEVMVGLPQGSPEQTYLSVTEAADYIRCSKQRIYDLTSARQLRVFKDGKRSLYLRSDLDGLLKAGDDR